QARHVLDLFARRPGHASSLRAAPAWVRCRSVRPPGGPVPTFVFLSDEWFDAARRVVDERDIEIPPGATLRMNVVVTGTPFGDDRRLHFDTGQGEPVWGHGHLEVVDLTLTTDYGTAREIFVGADLQGAMQAFFEGRVKVQ